jgi:hypothetical protein
VPSVSSPIRRPAIIGPALDIKPGMGQKAESGGKLIEALLQQNAGHRMNHLALQPDLDRSGPVDFAVFGIDRDHGMNKLMHQYTEHVFRFGQVSTDENFEMLIHGR